MVMTLVDLLRQRADAQPDRCAYTFLIDGENKEAHITYAELDHDARSIAAHLASHGARGERALLLYPPGLEFGAAFFGCLYAGAIPVPVKPPRRNSSAARLQGIAQEAHARWALTTTSMLNRLDAGPLGSMCLPNVRCLATDAMPERAADWKALEIRADDIAMLQYSSGSTSGPKGVILTHANILHNQQALFETAQHSRHSVIVTWLPHYHDMGLFASIVQALYAEARCVVMSPVAFLQRPVRWLRAISGFGGTHSNAPNFAYDLCVRRTKCEDRETLRLDTWRVAGNGSEPIRMGTMERFGAAFADCGFRMSSFYPAYGLAEATLFVTGGTVDGGPRRARFEQAALEQHRVCDADSANARAQELVSCGRPLASHAVVIVDPDTRAECPPDRVGEIWVAGPSVGLGYYNRADVTAATFSQCLADGRSGFVRTGDLGFMRDGELFIAGRLKDLIIIRGQKYAPHDIEWAAEQSHPALRVGCGAAFTVEENDEPWLVIVQEIDRAADTDVADIKGAIRQAVCESHDLQVRDVCLIRAGTIPKTSSGKVQRHVCRTQFLAGQLREFVPCASGAHSLQHTTVPPGRTSADSRQHPARASS